MAAGDRAESVNAGQHRQAERQGDAGEADAQMRKGRRENRAAATAEDE